MRVYYLDRGALTEFIVRAHQVEKGISLPNTDEGRAELGQHLATLPGESVRLMADLGGENIVVQMLPFTSGKDRQEMLKRKAQQLLNNTPFSLTRSLGREKIGRKDERILFYGLAQADRIQAWMSVFRASKTSFSGLITPAMATQALLPKFIAKHKHESFLVMLHYEAGLHQFFYNDGTLHASRVIALPGDLPTDVIAGRCVAEATQLRRYLVGQQLLSRADALKVFTLIPHHWTSSFDAQIHSVEEVDFRPLPFEEVAKSCGFTTTQYLPRELLVYSAGRFSISPQLAPTSMLATWKRYRLVNYLSYCAFGAGGILALSGFVFWGLSHHQEARLMDIRNELKLQQVQYDELLKKLPPLPLPVDNLRDEVEKLDQLQNKSPQMLSVFVHISHALDQFPRVQLSSIQWLANATPVTTTINMQLPASFIANQRLQLDTSEAFATALNKDGYRAVVVRKPFDIDSTKPLSGGGGIEAAADLPTFTVRLESPPSP